ncbi:MAG TPA: hypothetical protein ENK66_10355, partial [Arcobacter sp.]|nr:hypothetical protein [Arcobacter sp.]
MKFNKILLLVIFLTIISFAKEEIVNINFKNLQIMDLVKITSKVINKNILLTNDIKGKVDFISNKPVSRDDILNILIYTLETKGYTIVDNEGILRIVRINDAAKYNRTVVNETIDTYQVITEVFSVENSNVDYVSSKVRHLISSSAKLVTDKESNSIVITDFAGNIKTIKKVIDLIAMDNEKHIEIIKLVNLQASSIQAELTNMAKALYNEKIEKEKVSILVNKDTNSVMLIGKKQNVSYLTDYVKDVDSQGSLVAKSVEVIRLKNVESKNILTMLNGILANKQYKDVKDKPYVAADEESNTLILMGAKDEIGYFKEVIEKLDIDRQQVYVEAKIIEINEDKVKEVGLKYGMQGFGANQKVGLGTFSSKLNGGNDVATVDLTNIGSIGGLNIDTMKKGLSLGASLNLLNQNGAADIVSEPSILCINNKASTIYVGATKSIKTGSTTNSGGNVQDTYKREDIGLTLKIKPRISNANKVTLEIETKLEEAEETATNDQPDTYKRELTTTAIVNNGENVILGGYIKSKEGSTVDKIPFLGDIPILGTLFRNTVE